MQVAGEAAADGLLSEDELADTVAELRGTYTAALAALGVNPSTVPDVRLDDSEEEEEEEEERRLGQARERAWSFAQARALTCETPRAAPSSLALLAAWRPTPPWAAVSRPRRTALC